MNIKPWPHSPYILARVEVNGVYAGHEVVSPSGACAEHYLSYDVARRTAEQCAQMRKFIEDYAS